MIFLPNYFERYAAALRSSVQKMISKKGVTPLHIKMLMKIYEAEALFSYREIYPYDLGKFLHCLIMAAAIKLSEQNRTLSVGFELNGVFLINKKLLSCLILRLLQTADFIRLKENQGQLAILSNADLSGLELIIKRLNGIAFSELKTGKSLIIIKAFKTDKRAYSTKKEWEYILNPFSSVNLFLNPKEPKAEYPTPPKL